MNEYQNLILNFYTALDRRDAESMIKAYAENIHFSDPIFPNLRGKEPKKSLKDFEKRN